jgi:putative hydrolase
MRSGTPKPTTSPEQQVALSRLETLLALVEGWVDVVVADAVGDRLPGADALRETLRRRRASGGPAEQTFATLVGMELRPRKLRAASELWRELTVSRGVPGRDAVWNHPDLVPTAEDLDDVHGFVHRPTAASDLDDPIAALERSADTAPREQGPGRPPQETEQPPHQSDPEGDDS